MRPPAVRSSWRRTARRDRFAPLLRALREGLVSHAIGSVLMAFTVPGAASIGGPAFWKVQLFLAPLTLCAVAMSYARQALLGRRAPLRSCETDA